MFKLFVFEVSELDNSVFSLGFPCCCHRGGKKRHLMLKFNYEFVTKMTGWMLKEKVGLGL